MDTFRDNLKAHLKDWKIKLKNPLRKLEIFKKFLRNSWEKLRKLENQYFITWKQYLQNETEKRRGVQYQRNYSKKFLKIVGHVP